MKIAVFLDGRPGHEKQSLAIILWLQKLANIEIVKISIGQRSTPERIGDTFRYLLCPKSFRYDLDGVDLLLGTGSSLHPILLACKRNLSIPAVTCMAPDRLFRSSFDLCMVPRHDNIPVQSNILLTDGPPVLPAPNFIREESSGLILLGGIDHKSHVWKDDDILRQVTATITALDDIDWKISTSPRTPDSTVVNMKKLQKRFLNVCFYPFQETPSGWVEEQYAKSTISIVTADSISMVYESVTAGCKTGVLPVQWLKADNKFQRSLESLFSKNYAVEVNDNNPLAVQKIDSPDFNEAKRCAIEIISRFT